MKNLRQLLHINGEQETGSDHILLVEIGERYCCIGEFNHPGRELTGYAYYLAEKPEEDPAAKVFSLHPRLFNRCMVNYTHADSILIPETFYKPGDENLHLRAVYGLNDNSAVVRTHIPGWKLFSVFRIPQNLHELLTRRFTEAKFLHNYSVQLSSISDCTDDMLFIDFRTDEIAVIVLEKNILQLAQTFFYSAPEDVLYYLLKICRQFSLSQHEVRVNLSGLIEKDSALYRELYKYFLHLDFASIPGGIKLSRAFSEFPVHYFSSICKLATCVL